MSLREPCALRLQFATFFLQAGQRAIGIRDRALRFAQRIARLRACGFLLIELGLERVDATAQLLKILL